MSIVIEPQSSQECDSISFNPPDEHPPILPQGEQGSPPWTPFTQVLPFRTSPSHQILLNKNDQFIYDAVSKYGEYSPGEVRLWEDMVGPEDAVVEVGANMGVHTVALAGLAGEVLAFEPQRLMYQILNANVALNSLHNVYTMQAAVGDRRDVIKVPTLNPYKFQSYGSLEIDTPKMTFGEDTVMVTLDGMGLTRLDFLKLDCEGCELKVLLGAREVIMKYRPWIYLEYTAHRSEILGFMQAAGYGCCRHLPEHIEKDNYLKKEIQDGDNYASDMLVCFPKDRRPKETMLDGFGDRHMLIVPTEQDILGSAKEVVIVEPYGKPVNANAAAS